MTRNDGVVEMLYRACGGGDPNPTCRALQTNYFGLVPNALAPGRGESFDILLGPTGDGPPLMLRIQTKKAVIMKKPQQGSRGKSQHFIGRR